MWWWGTQRSACWTSGDRQEALSVSLLPGWLKTVKCECVVVMFFSIWPFWKKHFKTQCSVFWKCFDIFVKFVLTNVCFAFGISCWLYKDINLYIFAFILCGSEFLLQCKMCCVEVTSAFLWKTNKRECLPACVQRTNHHLYLICFCFMTLIPSFALTGENTWGRLRR